MVVDIYRLVPRFVTDTAVCKTGLIYLKQMINYVVLETIIIVKLQVDIPHVLFAYSPYKKK